MVRISGSLFLCGTAFLMLLTQPTCNGRAIYAPHDDDDADGYVRQVIEEDQRYYGEDGRYYYDEYNVDETVHDDGNQDGANSKSSGNNQTSEPVMTDEERRQAEAERAAQEQADRIAAERERKFQAELDRMDDEQKKAALKQKKRDRRRVHAVLRAARNGDLYGVLGIRNWNLQVPARDIRLPGGIYFQIPGLSLKTTTQKDIRQQFRSRAIQVHPDKNKDGRAQEAFIAVEYAASILSDSQQRALYDEERRLAQAQRRIAHRQIVTATATSALQIGKQLVRATHTILGPFFIPVLIIGFLVL